MGSGDARSPITHATELDKLEAFSGFASSIENNKKDWQVWFMAEQPEEMPMPDGFSDKLNELQRVAVMRAMRSDGTRVLPPHCACRLGYVASPRA